MSHAMWGKNETIISLSFTHAHDHKAIGEGKMFVQRAIPLDSFDWLRDQLRQLS